MGRITKSPTVGTIEVGRREIIEQNEIFSHAQRKPRWALENVSKIAAGLGGARRGKAGRGKAGQGGALQG